MTLAFWLGLSYLVGAIPTSFLVARLARGIDLRHVGSKNLGATNLYRQLGWRFAVPVAAFDVAKGVVPVLAFGPRAGGGFWIPILCGVVAVIGHVYSVFVRFRGGKGVATSAGVVLGLAPWAFVVALVIWVVTVRLSGYVSLGSVLAAAALPVVTWLLYPDRRDTVGLLAGLAVFVIALHRGNIRRLLNGTENRFGRRAAASGGGV